MSKTYSHLFFKESAVHAKVRCIVQYDSMPNTFPTAFEVDENVKSVCRVQDLPEYKACSRSLNKSTETLRFGKTGGFTVESNLI